MSLSLRCSCSRRGSQARRMTCEVQDVMLALERSRWRRRRKPTTGTGTDDDAASGMDSSCVTAAVVSCMGPISERSLEATDSCSRRGRNGSRRTMRLQDLMPHLFRTRTFRFGKIDSCGVLASGGSSRKPSGGRVASSNQFPLRRRSVRDVSCLASAAISVQSLRRFPCMSREAREGAASRASSPAKAIISSRTVIRSKSSACCCFLILSSPWNSTGS
mmetsp:Transcript_53885/g.73604  ORF Transcript_53885/g.73604 Transcript_53885/m.73604 type:complete len:218 (-) Transcript_53885:465-1118(-)